MVDLSFNKLKGMIPLQLGDLHALTTLILSFNDLTGKIPEELGRRGNLHALLLSDNLLTGSIPESLGATFHMEFLNLTDNRLSGRIPPLLRKHPFFSTFQMEDEGLDIPKVKGRCHALGLLLLPVFLSYLDIGTDIYTSYTYYDSGHEVWGHLGLIFALLPGIIVALFFVTDGIVRRLLVVLQLSVLVEACTTATRQVYSRTLGLVRVVEPLFEAVPQLLLQFHAILVLWNEETPSPNPLFAPFRSVFISVVSLAYAATDISSVEGLSKSVDQTKNGASNRCSICPRPACCWPTWCPWSVTKRAFGRAPTKGEVKSGCLAPMHPQTQVWVCFLYHILEVVSRFIPLGFVILLTRSWFIGVLVYFWLSRAALVGWMAWKPGDRRSRVDAALDEFSSLRFKVRVVAMPFLDSIIFEGDAFLAGLLLTVLEFGVFMGVYHAYPSGELASHERLVFTIIAVACLAVKMLLAQCAILPLKQEVARVTQSDEKKKREEIVNAKIMEAKNMRP